MSQDNQGIPSQQERIASGVGSGAETSEGSHRITINDPSSSIDHSKNNPKSIQLPTSPTSSKLRRRISTYNDDDDDDDDDEYDSEDSRGHNKRKDLRRRQSHRRKKSSKSSISSNVEDDAIDDENQNDGGDEDESDHEFTLKDRQEVSLNICYHFLLVQIKL